MDALVARVVAKAKSRHWRDGGQGMSPDNLDKIAPGFTAFGGGYCLVLRPMAT